MGRSVSQMEEALETQSYTAGQIIPITVSFLGNHGGFVQMCLCPEENTNPAQSCFDANILNMCAAELCHPLLLCFLCRAALHTFPELRVCVATLCIFATQDCQTQERLALPWQPYNFHLVLVLGAPYFLRHPDMHGAICRIL